MTYLFKVVMRPSIVLKTLVAHELYANRGNCVIGKNRVAYLGHIILAKGVFMD